MAWPRLRLRRTLAVAAALFSVAAAAQTPVDQATAPLSHGTIVLWIVHPADASWTPEKRAQQTPLGLPTTVQEQTAGSFGQSSSDTGQTAGSYGQTASTLGHSSSDVGQTSGSYGVGPAAIGHASSDVGQTAGSYGQTAGSYGESLSTIAQATNTLPAPSRLTVNHTAQWDGITVQLHKDFPGLEVKLFDVHEQDLVSELQQSAGSSEAPDVLLGSPLPWRWTGTKGNEKARLILAALGDIAYPAQVEGGLSTLPNSSRWSPQLAILNSAPHHARAQAFAIWVSDGGVCTTCGQPVSAAAAVPAAAAREALSSLLATGGLTGNADPEIAQWNSDWVRQSALGSLHPDAGGQRYTVDVIAAEANSHLATVELRAIAAAQRNFAVLHALVVLRKDSSSQWRVLQITPDLSSPLLHQAAGTLGEFCKPGSQLAVVAGIAQAAPPDGDTRPPSPELWWDNKGGAQLQVVEWQQGDGEDNWSGTRLFFAPDRDPHLRTRLSAEFATEQGLYRWRVWSVGNGGALVLSPWRTLNIVE